MKSLNHKLHFQCAHFNKDLDLLLFASSKYKTEEDTAT